jgi:hypothetical protein
VRVSGASPGEPGGGARSSWLVVFSALALFVILVGELALSVREQSQTGDEGCHIFAGYQVWTRGDFGLNPEHPPLVKLVAAIPLLGLPLNVPSSSEASFKAECFFGASRFLYGNDADRILFRARLAASVFTLLLAVFVFVATQRFFGFAPALVALVLFCFEPNILAHGALVTTDVAVSWGIFASVYTFHRYAQGPSVFRLIGCGLVVGSALVTKHSAVLIIPVLVLVCVVEILQPREGRRKGALRMAVGLLVIAAISVLLVWASYGFRFQARPDSRKMSPSLAEFAPNNWHGALILMMARWRLLPESYLYGFADVSIVSSGRSMFLFGEVYPTGRWFYFPTAFTIKSTLAFLLLLAAVPLARGAARREALLFVAPPVLVLVAVSLTFQLNIGIRHILPLYPFLIVLIAATAWNVARHQRQWRAAVVGLLLFHVISSLRSFPDYLPYSNEIWGGPANTYKVLTDSNVDWGQGLKATKQYLDRRGITECWFAYFPRLVVDPAYYGIPCRPLPTFFVRFALSNKFAGLENLPGVALVPVPSTIRGPVLVGATELSGVHWGPAELNPYRPFLKTSPLDVIAGSVLVFEGTFDVPRLASESHAVLPGQSAATGRSE